MKLPFFFKNPLRPLPPLPKSIFIAIFVLSVFSGCELSASGHPGRGYVKCACTEFGSVRVMTQNQCNACRQKADIQARNWEKTHHYNNWTEEQRQRAIRNINLK